MDWSPLIPTAVGGLLAVAGGMVAQYLTHRFTRQRETEKLRLAKAEELLHELYAHEEWVDAKHNALLFQQSHDTPSPLNRASAIQRLYFPKLTQAFWAFREGSDPYVTALLVSHHEAHRARTQPLEPDAGGTEPGPHEDLDRLHRTYLEAWRRVVDEVMAVIEPTQSSRSRR